MSTPDKFQVTISLVNEAMQTPADIARALRTLASKLTNMDQDLDDQSGKVFDYNGNAVGTWSIE